ncbi:Hypothetical predicted protein [Pelobates cultripes]|uniref:Choline transporter-like protein n=1 Tax=Pelobates cultripes TaxID=61616 RepID=A0AAD1SYU4_PELCU|nr:Hypothetical predicted protein [Pelobates cultripes]
MNPTLRWNRTCVSTLSPYRACESTTHCFYFIGPASPPRRCYLSLKRLVFSPSVFENVQSGNPPTTKYVFFLDSCNLEIRNLKINSIALCVSSCPQEPLKSLEDLQLFAKNNGSYLCIYRLNFTEYTSHPLASKWCPVLPVPSSKSIPLFNRCVPQSPDCYSRFASVLINVVNEVDFFHRILSGIMAGRENVIILSILAVALSILMVLAFRYISALLVHMFVTLVVFGLLFVSGILWWLYYDHKNDPSYQLETGKENARLLLVFSIVSTIITVVLLSLIFILKKRISMTIQLFEVASKFISCVPLLILQPLWTFIILIFYWVFWVAVLLGLGTSGSARVLFEGQVEYKSLSGIRYMWWYHLIGLIWTSEFFLACQQMVIAGVTVTWYLQRDKKNVRHPILSSMCLLVWYYLGTAIAGSFLLTLLRIPRMILLYISQLLKQRDNACAKCTSRCCSCGFWCLEKWLRCLNQNAYAATIINGTPFCASAKDSYNLMIKNPPFVSYLNCAGVFMIFLGKVFVVCFTVFGGLMAFNYHRELHVWVVPLLLVAFFAYLVAHSFLSLFETVVHSLFLCYAVDIETNDGTPERPYFMEQDLMHETLNAAYQGGDMASIVDSIQCSSEALIHRTTSLPEKLNIPTQNGDEGTELQPIARAE